MRISPDVARRVREGHPWVFQEALQGRQLKQTPAAALDLLDRGGHFVGRAIHDPAGPVALRVFSRRPGETLDAAYLARAVTRAARLRRALAEVSPGGCFRALAGDSEGVPAVNVDFYAGYLVVMVYAAVAEAYLPPLLDALCAVWRPTGVYVQHRHRATPQGKSRPGAELVRGTAAPPEVVVSEGRARFVVDVSAPLGTGLFADMRDGRRIVARHAAGRRVVNCFSYTGAFSVVAALNGATKVVSIDSASRAHARARRNFSENGLDAGDRRFGFLTGDTFATLTRLAGRGERFDLAIVDPPTFSGGDRGRAFSALKDYADLVAATVAALAPDGVLCAASNAARLSAADFERAVARGGATAGRTLVISERAGLPPDYPVAAGFPEGSYLKFVVARG